MPSATALLCQVCVSQKWGCGEEEAWQGLTTYQAPAGCPLFPWVGRGVAPIWPEQHTAPGRLSVSLKDALRVACYAFLPVLNPLPFYLAGFWGDVCAGCGVLGCQLVPGPRWCCFAIFPCILSHETRVTRLLHTYHHQAPLRSDCQVPLHRLLYIFSTWFPLSF